MTFRRPSTDPARPAYWRRRGARPLMTRRLATATAADLPALRAALTEETALKMPDKWLLARLRQRIGEFSN